MNHPTSRLQRATNATALSTLLVLATAFASGCTLQTTSSDPLPSSSDTPVTKPGAQPAAGSGCDFAEPNDTREQAKAIELNRRYSALCVASAVGGRAEDLDFFEITAPQADVAGGVVEVLVSNVQNRGLTRIIVTAVADNGVIFDSYTTDEAASVSGWLSVSPGAKYRIQIGRFSGNDEQFAYDLFVKYTAIQDAFEPNNKKEDAKPLAVNKPVYPTAAAHSPNSKLDDADDQDWFRVSLGAGSATIKMTNVASDYLCDVQLLDAAGQSVGEKYATTAGADCVLDASELKGGSYFVKLRQFAGGTIRGQAARAPAAFMLQRYTLEVQQ